MRFNPHTTAVPFSTQHSISMQICLQDVSCALHTLTSITFFHTLLKKEILGTKFCSTRQASVDLGYNRTTVHQSILIRVYSR